MSLSDYGLSPTSLLTAPMAFDNGSQAVALGPCGQFCSPPPSSFNSLFQLNIFK